MNGCTISSGIRIFSTAGKSGKDKVQMGLPCGSPSYFSSKRNSQHAPAKGVQGIRDVRQKTCGGFEETIANVNCTDSSSYEYYKFQLSLCGLRCQFTVESMLCSTNGDLQPSMKLQIRRTV
ncbi:unnamed protein product [Darwinula stevensoni]|uniref:Uncharacterized protein n=1 Tax=Darwinula stevensoni TaxID=69355 RepID=A0A7R8X7S2_9CRUS|nr:unnamed protein product [Darwinula stevensoni]CAG0883678.1 unnamed protein product [Darwinula stevensoni]